MCVSKSSRPGPSRSSCNEQPLVTAGTPLGTLCSIPVIGAVERSVSRGRRPAAMCNIRGCLTMNTRRFEDLFYRFSLRPSLFICERFFLRSDVIRPLFKHILWRFQQIFYRTFSALHGSLRQACLILAGSGVVGSPRLLGELFPASMTLQQ